MRPTRAPARTARAGAVVSVVALVVGLLGLAGPAAPASADPLGSARARAATLAQQVQALEVQAELATEQYNGLQEQLGVVVSRYFAQEQQLQQLTDEQSGRSRLSSARVRALYMSGGSLGLYASVLDSGSILEALDRVTSVGQVLDADRIAIQAGSQRVADAARLTASLDALSAERTRLQRQAADARTRVEGLLAQRRTQLTDAGTLVRRLVEEDRARAAAAAAARAALVLSTAGVAPVDLPPGTPTTIAAAIGAARTRLGLPYVWGATGPNTFDCSGLTQWAYRQAGVNLPRTSREQWFAGPHPALADLRPGDLLFWATNTANPATIHHVGLYLGGGYLLHAPHTGDVVRVAAVQLDGYIGATRPYAAPSPVP